ncbi:hypothetical protein DICPUDRAFT_79275 [Dictyostelium purpureum]|uniref:Uncharacterized protein n=1 Tax=Dictyostelium purpureum TaxID=5786 RepID=F0ZM36_DICPU|nr:uncharacterized protein DICPUDRAFT_79275 [Dictyostelium purpureum]XP_003295206.1 uncharacterized protein DICPUDRAFT_85621 [Dictyostelium purpureum]EGC28269.1 hypothetical protein DICPUDRAFT_85621 [Dictyostelium purpureum]EGC35008.1 hypothetical protein DICPUDRAFT_79275 [Dictyostelium purpureum]|eukprot:XP_003288482.1 hypothetical protein DICPUDRAFT_79275 [Dictyostelium purpureum]
MIVILFIGIFLFIVVGSIFYFYFGKFIFKKNKGCRCSTIKGEFCRNCAFNEEYWARQRHESQLLEDHHKLFRYKLFEVQMFRQHSFLREKYQQKLQLYDYQIKLQKQQDLPYEQQIQRERHQRQQLKENQILQEQQLNMEQEQVRQQQLHYQRLQQFELFHQIEQQHIQELQQKQQQIQQQQLQQPKRYFCRFF